MNRKSILLIDAIINFLLAFLLGIYPKDVISFLGLPMVSNPFYASILGGVFFGIGIALLINRSSKSRNSDGLGLRGALAINISGGLVLALWLLFGDLDVPALGKIMVFIALLTDYFAGCISFKRAVNMVIKVFIATIVNKDTGLYVL